MTVPSRSALSDRTLASEERERSLPSQWFRDERIFHIERRAIFSKLWILSTHTSRFEKSGDYLKLEIAGYPYFVIKTKEGGYNAFHNVCRHRAFPLIHKETGSSTIIGCKYHGWSYNSSSGALIKAPQFSNEAASPNFNKEENGLFKIHTHVTSSGFIFINLDAAPIQPGEAELETSTLSISPTGDTVNPKYVDAADKSIASSKPSLSIEIDNVASVPKAIDENSLSSQSLINENEQLVEERIIAAPNSPAEADARSPVSPTSTLGGGPEGGDSSASVERLDSIDAATPVLNISDIPFASETPSRVSQIEYTVPFKEHFGTLPNEWDGFKPDEYEYAYSWSRLGPYNWKTFMDGYQECYHCQIAHPGFAKSLALETYAVAPKKNYARHTANSKSGPTAIRPVGAREDETPPTFTFIFPTNGVTVTETMWYMMRAVPVNAVETRMEYDVFKRKTVSMDEVRQYMQFYEQVEDEDFLLCSATQRNLNSGIYNRGFLHPEKEVGVLFYQSQVRAFVEEHLTKEKSEGREINPAQPASQVEIFSSCSGGDTVCASLGPEMTW